MYQFLKICQLLIVLLLPFQYFIFKEREKRTSNNSNWSNLKVLLFLSKKSCAWKVAFLRNQSLRVNKLYASLRSVKYFATLFRHHWDKCRVALQTITRRERNIAERQTFPSSSEQFPSPTTALCVMTVIYEKELKHTLFAERKGSREEKRSNEKLRKTRVWKA